MSGPPAADPRLEVWRQKVAAAPANLLFRFSLGQALLQAGDAPGAIEHLQHCVAGRRDWLLAHLLLAQAHRAHGDVTNARQHFAEALVLAEAQHHEDPATAARQALAELDAGGKPPRGG